VICAASFLGIFSKSSCGQLPVAKDVTPLSTRIKFEPTREWISEYFAKRENADDDITRLFQDVGSTNFRERRAAQQKLRELGHVPQKLIEKFTDSNNPEIRFFARSLTQKYAAVDRMYINLILQAIAKQKIRGFAGSLFPFVSPAASRYRKWTLPIAVWATVTPDDETALMELAAGDELEKRRAAIWGLSGLKSETAQAKAIELSKVDAQLKLDRALALLSSANPLCVSQFVDLLNDEKPSIRVTAEMCLRELTGQWKGFIGATDPEKRKPTIEAWKKWLAENPSNLSALKFFVPIDLFPEMRLLGNSLEGFKSANGNSGLVEKGPDGTVVYQYGLYPSFWAEKLANGNVLTTTRIDDVTGVAEITPQGEVVWRHEQSSIFKCHKLPNGNVLICCQDAMRLLEVNSENDVVWGMVTNGKCNDSLRAPDGTLFVATDNGLFAIDKDSNESPVFRDHDVSSISLLPDGDFLLTAWKAKKVVRLSPNGKKRWEFTVSQPAYAEMKLDGSILVAAGSGFYEYDENQKLKKKTSGISGRVFTR
jgi:hypothetical protein